MGDQDRRDGRRCRLDVAICHCGNVNSYYDDPHDSEQELRRQLIEN